MNTDVPATTHTPSPTGASDTSFPGLGEGAAREAESSGSNALQTGDDGHLPRRRSDITCPPGALDGVRILVVDDTADGLESFCVLLGLEGAVVTGADGARTALDLLRHHRFDVMVSDVAMPDMDGYQLIRQVRADPAIATLPAVALSGFGRHQDARKALTAGFDAHLSKPIDMERLFAVVNGFVAAGEPRG